mgnify:CR=1 FL=1|jgi:hypothetical protein
MTTKEEKPLGLNELQTSFYNRYVDDGYSNDSALHLASMAGMSIEGGFVSDPEVYIRTHPPAFLAWLNFHSTGVIEDFHEHLFPYRKMD